MTYQYIAFDQYNNNFKIKKYPRKELLEHLGRERAEKMYIDTADGKTMHIGYVIGGHWLSVFKLSPFKEAD